MSVRWFAAEDLRLSSEALCVAAFDSLSLARGNRHPTRGSQRLTPAKLVKEHCRLGTDDHRGSADREPVGM
jgi:hypothetical protein